MTNTCGFCQHEANSRVELDNHILNLHSPVNRSYACLCGVSFRHEEQLTYHRYHQCQDERVLQQPAAPKKKIKKKKRQNRVTAFSEHLISDFAWTYEYKDGTRPSSDTDPNEPIEDEGTNNVDPLLMVPRARAEISAAVQKGLLQHGNLRVHMTALVRFQRDTPEGTHEIPFHSASRSFIVQNMQHFRGHYEAEMARMVNNLQDFTENGSGWRIHQCMGFQYDLARYAPIAGGNFLPTPKSIVKKKAVVNLRNLYDDNCLVYSIAAALFVHDNPEQKSPRRVSAIPAKYLQQVPVEGLKSPYFVEELSTLEQRDERLALNCFSMHVEDEARHIIPIRISDYNYQPTRLMINLLLLYDGNGRYHYVWVKNIDRLMCKTRGKSTGKMCVNCQHTVFGANRFQRFEEHLKHCKKKVMGRLQFPKGPLRFNRVATQHRKGFTIYADFESCLHKVDEVVEPPPSKKPKKHISHRTEEFSQLIQQFAFPNYCVPEISPGGAGTTTRESGPLLAKGQGPDIGTQCTLPAGQVMNQHGLLSYTLVLISPKKKFNKVYSYSDVGEEKVKAKFVDDFYRCKQVIENYYADHVESALVMKKLTAEQEAKHEAATECYVCKLPFIDFVTAGVSKNKFFKLREEGRLQWRNPHDKETFVPLALLKGPKVRDHDHDTGIFRGSAHRNCNVQLKRLIRTPVFFHNGSRYDYHHLITTLAEESNRLDKKKVEVIGKTMERFTTLTWENFEFKDSFNFLQTSLDKMVKNLKTKVNDKIPPSKVFKYTMSHFENMFPVEQGFPSQAEKEKLLLRKGVMCYEYIDDPKVLLQRSLPPRAAFTSQLRGGEEISLEDYQHARRVWDAFKMKTMRDYLNLYCILDTLLLADCFEEFRSMSMKYFSLDPVHFHTAPSLAWSAALLTTKVELDIIQEPEMLDFLNGGLLGGYSAVHHQYAMANNPNMHDFDETRPVSTCICLDANNLYGKCMCLPLPTHNFRWVDLNADSRFQDATAIQDFESDGPTGVFLEVDLEYPSSLHEDHNDLPLAPEKITVTREHLSPFQAQLADDLNLNLGGVKLVTQLTPKKKIVLHIKNLQQYLRLGLVLTKVHRVLEFNQSAWLKPYIEKNIEGRRLATCQHMKNFFKLMINCIYGKCVEDVLNYRDINICLEADKFDSLVSSPLFQKASIHSENFVTVEMQKAIHKMDRPRYVGITILALAKVELYKFHYDVMKKKFKDSRLLFTDTDSLSYHITHPPTVDVFAELKETGCVDFSNFPPEHAHFSKEFELVPGKWKDENSGTCVREFVGLRSKMYSFLYENGGVKSTAKGVQKNFQIQHLNHEEYKRVLFNLTMTHVENINIRTNGHHQLFTVKTTKIGLNPLNDKRYITSDGESLAFGHCKIMS